MFKKKYFAKMWLVLAEVCILTPQRHGAGAYWEALKLFRAQFLTIYWHLAEDTFFWAKIYALVSKHCYLTLNLTLEVPI